MCLFFRPEAQMPSACHPVCPIEVAQHPVSMANVTLFSSLPALLCPCLFYYPQPVSTVSLQEETPLTGVCAVAARGGG